MLKWKIWGWCILPLFTLTSVSSVQFRHSVGLTLCDPMNRSTPGLPVHHQLPESTQTQVHWVGDAIQPSHPLSSPSPPAPNPSQHQGLFQWVNSSHEVAKYSSFSFSCAQLFATTWTVVCQAPLSMEFSRSEYWGSSQGIEPRSPTLQAIWATRGAPATREAPYLLLVH